MARIKAQLIIGPRALLSIAIQLFQEAVEVGTPAGSRDVKEEEQILEVQFIIPTIVGLRGGIRPAPDGSLAALVVAARGAGEREHGD